MVLIIFLAFLTLIKGSDPDPYCLERIRTRADDISQCNFYEKPTETQALIEVRGKYIALIGESTLRQTFEQMAALIKTEPSLLVEDHKEKGEQIERFSNAVLRYRYDCFFNNATKWLKKPSTWFDRPPDLVILQDGLHDLLYNFDNFDADFQAMVEQIKSNPNLPILFLTLPALVDENLSKHRATAQQFRKKEIQKKNKMMVEALKGISHVYIADFFVEPQSEEQILKYFHDGLHNMERARLEAEALINGIRLFNNSEFFAVVDWTPGQIMFFLVYAMITIVVLPAELLMRLFSTASYEKIKMNQLEEESETLVVRENGKQVQQAAPETVDGPIIISGPFSFLQFPLNYYKENKAGFHSVFFFCCLLFTVFLVDGPGWRPFNPALKKYNRDFFLFLHVMFLVVSYLCMKPNFRSLDTVLSRDQTEEWKGIMQIIFVMYHYFAAGEIYNLIRIFIAAYVWQTGYGNTAFFLNPKKPLEQRYSLTRLFGLLFRLNWLVFWVCSLLDQPLLLYYICPLHTFFFLFTFLTCLIGKEHNQNLTFFFGKLAVGFVLLFVLFDVNGVFEIVFAPMRWLLDLYGSLHEWKFRSTLDHYATWFGIVCCILYPHLVSYIKFSEGKGRTHNLTYKGMLIAPWIIALGFWGYYIYPLPKFEYNQLHPYTSMLPVIFYILIRNANQESRRWHSGFLAWMGKITLETYIFQYHLYLQDDAKSIIVIFEGYPLVNFAILSVFYIFCSYIAFNCTNTLRNTIYPMNQDSTTSLKRTCYLLASIAMFYGAAHLTLRLAKL